LTQTCRNQAELATLPIAAPVVPMINNAEGLDLESLAGNLMWNGDASAFLDLLPEEPLFDLVFTSPPYNIGKAYEMRQELEHYLSWQEDIIRKTASRLKPSGSMCWQVGTFLGKDEGG